MACADQISGPGMEDKRRQLWRNHSCLGGSGLAEPVGTPKGKVECADAAPKPSKQVVRERGEPYAATNGTYGFGEGDTGDPEKGDRPLLYM